MKNHENNDRPDGIAFHLAAIIAGLLMIVTGLGLGVTMVLLPVGLPLGLVGLLVFVWGLTPALRK
jgi:hypothetical protein